MRLWCQDYMCFETAKHMSEFMIVDHCQSVSWEGGRCQHGRLPVPIYTIIKCGIAT